MNEIELPVNSKLITINEEQIAKINARLPEYHRGNAIIGHSTSQTSYSLQTMNMISDSPLSRMKQCLAQIGHKYQALQEAYYKIENKKLVIEELSKKSDKKSRLKIREEEANISTISVSMENALRQIGMFQDMYDSIKKNNNIPDNWSEKDFEKQEIQHMIRSSFRLAIQDLTANDRISRACVEWWEQLGIHPQVGEIVTKKYMNEVTEILSKCESKENVDNNVTLDNMTKFLDEMVERFGEQYKRALKRIGLDEIGSEEFMAGGQTKPR